MDEYEVYERECARIRKENVSLLADFGSWLEAKGLSPRTVRQHSENIDFYTNVFLLYNEAIPAARGAGEVGYFLGFFIIRKVFGTTQSAIRSNVASLKKFYTFLLERGQVDEEIVVRMKDQMKEQLPRWLETKQRYDDPTLSPEEVWDW